VKYANLLLVPILAIAFLAGCGGGGGDGGTIPIPPTDDNTNQAPIINSISPQGTSASPIKIKLGAGQHIVVAASDPDNDPLTITWTVDKGQIVGNGTDADFTAPQTTCNAIVNVRVSDDHNHTVSAQCYFSVFKENEEEPPPPEQNDPPVISAVIADPSEVDLEGTSSITAQATDPDGDPLVYSWICNGGSVQSQNNNSVIWKAPNAARTCTVTVSVSDGNNPAVTKSVDVKVNGSTEPGITNGLSATYIQNGPDIAHPNLSKGTVVFTRTDPTINFDWGRKAPDARLITLPATGNGHDFGVIWKGYIKCTNPGVYNFRVKCDDGAKLYISDDNGAMQTIIDVWDTGPGTFEGQITLQGGKWYKIKMDYYEDEDRSYVQLYWLPPQATVWAIVPTEDLRTDQ
jgi:hypothetical protein